MLTSMKSSLKLKYTSKSLIPQLLTSDDMQYLPHSFICWDIINHHTVHTHQMLSLPEDLVAWRREPRCCPPSVQARLMEHRSPISPNRFSFTQRPDHLSLHLLKSLQTLTCTPIGTDSHIKRCYNSGCQSSDEPATPSLSPPHLCCYCNWCRRYCHALNSYQKIHSWSQNSRYRRGLLFNARAAEIWYEGFNHIEVELCFVFTSIFTSVFT